MSPEIRIVIADDHPVFRRGLQMVITSDPMLKVVGEASGGTEAVSIIETLHPDVAVLDIDMPDKNGFDVVRRVQTLPSVPKIVFLTMHQDEALFNGAFDLGVQGYLLKDSAVTDIIKSIKAVAAGEHFISSSLSTFLVNRSRRSVSLLERKPTIEDLTPTERRVLRLIAENKTSKEIADLLCISLRTVENHRAHICQKLDLRGAHALLKFALTHKQELCSG
ncbi:MAG TPA: response regulator transcription factor [Acidobacteriota bacterium]|nr:response regulator transcription factor [Acidobacteriota bacterium]HNC42964.1 response regulator transcription factor [Acidobacteriota bacterium]HND21372.1 response regulator transcription factor [Acidobacteriota bacterium]HNG95372.1 response regulator transcription factor [Acidobacteriota bacterium]HNH82499.1 response regulator transcription factor [Acidobacteriota bacterium]